MVVLDTNVIIGFLRGKTDVVEALNKYDPSELATTFVNQYELLKYMPRRELEKSIKNLTVYQLSEDSVASSSDAFKMLKEQGNLISDNDLLIFGVCAANDEVLLTLDKDFAKLHSNRIILLK